MKNYIIKEARINGIEITTTVEEKETVIEKVKNIVNKILKGS